MDQEKLNETVIALKQKVDSEKVATEDKFKVVHTRIDTIVNNDEKVHERIYKVIKEVEESVKDLTKTLSSFVVRTLFGAFAIIAALIVYIFT